MLPRLFVTGFGPFRRVPENPSAWLAARLGLPYQVLDVSFEAVEAFLRDFDPRPYDGLLMLGVHGRTKDLRVEKFARNRIGKRADVGGETRQGPIDPDGAHRLKGTLWEGCRPPAAAPVRMTWSAGSYLCNYSYYRALQSLTGLRVGFLHVPLTKRMPAERQLEIVLDVVRSIKAG